MATGVVVGGVNGREIQVVQADAAQYEEHGAGCLNVYSAHRTPHSSLLTLHLSLLYLYSHVRCTRPVSPPPSAEWRSRSAPQAAPTGLSSIIVAKRIFVVMSATRPHTYVHPSTDRGGAMTAEGPCLRRPPLCLIDRQTISSWPLFSSTVSSSTPPSPPGLSPPHL